MDAAIAAKKRELEEAPPEKRERLERQLALLEDAVIIYRPVKMTNDTMDFDDWLVALGNLARNEECSDYVGWTGVECWRQAYEDGLTPGEAWQQEKDAGYDLGG